MGQSNQPSMAGFGVALTAVCVGLYLMCGGKPIDMGPKLAANAQKHAEFVAAQRATTKKDYVASLYHGVKNVLFRDANAQQPKAPTNRQTTPRAVRFNYGD